MERKFVEESYGKHRNICQKVFGTKRKEFNTAAQRLGDLEDAKALVTNAKK